VLYAVAMLAFVPLRDMVKKVRVKESAAHQTEAVGSYSSLLSRSGQR